MATCRCVSVGGRGHAVAFTATSYSIADPNDPGMLDVVGFDSAAPPVMSQFAAG
ncbi:MAG: hypothetical protein ACJ76N_29355 [Thermoanaerobaculia bacterium]